MGKQQYTLYWDEQRATMLAAELESGSEYTFDGAHREMPQTWAEDHLYGRVEISQISPSADLSLLPHAKIFCQITPITPPHNTALESLDKGQQLILDQTDQPLAQVLRYLNRHKDTAWYRMDVERRAIISSLRYGDKAEFVSMAGSWPGEIQWCYQGAAWSYELWSPHEQAPLEEMLRQYLTNQHRVYWVFEKRPESMTKYHYYARLHTWQTGWHGADTPERLAALVEQKEFSRS